MPLLRAPIPCLLVAAALSLSCPMARAAISEGENRRLEAGGASQGGPGATSSKYRQQLAVGEAVSGNRIVSSRFRLTPGFLGAASGTSPSAPVQTLDITVLIAKTDALGPEIPPQTWQTDATPFYVWQVPLGSVDVAGYSYAFGEEPDDIIDTTATSLDVAEREEGPLADGPHVFRVKAINTAGNAGQPAALELWVDRLPPQGAASSPAAGSLLNTANPAVTATVTDAHSGVDPATLQLLVNGTPASVTFDEATGALATVGAAGWTEGANSLELRAADRAGNALVPLVWGVTLDTTPPTGTVTINAGADATTSVYVTLQLSASDAVSGVARMRLSNEELAGYVEEPFAVLRELWRLTAVRGSQRVYVKFVDGAGNESPPVSDDIDLWLLSPETVITSGPGGFTPVRSASFAFMCPEGGCVFSYAFDHDEWSAWSAAASASASDLAYGNHYFRVKAAKDVNGTPGIQPDEEDPSPAERTWIVGVQPPVLAVPQGPPIKLWRLD
jgi:hypothetical protein